MPNRLYTDEELDTLRTMHKRIDNPRSRWPEIERDGEALGMTVGTPGAGGP